MQEYKLGFNHGDAHSHTYASFAYENRQGIIIGTGTERYSGLIKYDRKIFKWLTAGARVNLNIRRNDRNNITLNGVSNGSAVCLSPLVGPEDEWNRYSDEGGSGGSVYNSPYLLAKNITNYLKTKYLSVAPWVEITPISGLTLKSTFSANWSIRSS